jgi:hypothetical protein
MRQNFVPDADLVNADVGTMGMSRIIDLNTQHGQVFLVFSQNLKPPASGAATSRKASAKRGVVWKGGNGMKKTLMILTLWLQVLPASALQPLLDEKTGEYSLRGLVAAMIGAAQAIEMRCGINDQNSATLAEAERVGTPFDLNDKMDSSDVQFFAADFLKQANKLDADKWCKDKAPGVMEFLQSR